MKVMISAPYMQRALVEIGLLAVLAGVLGGWIVLRRLAFFTHSVGTAAFPGLVVAGAWGIAPQLAALVSAVGFAGARERLARGGDGDEDAATGILLLLARTGMRLGEALALQWQDLNFAEREIRVARALGAAGRIDTPKSGRGRTVDVSQELVRTLRRLELERKTETLKGGWSALPLWVFCDSTGRPLSPRTVEDAFKRVLKAIDVAYKEERGDIDRAAVAHGGRHRGEVTTKVQRTQRKHKGECDAHGSLP